MWAAWRLVGLLACGHWRELSMVTELVWCERCAAPVALLEVTAGECGDGDGCECCP